MRGAGLKLALRILARRKFFTFVSLFGTCFTLAVLLVVVAGIDHLTAPAVPEVNLRRTLDLRRMCMRGPENEWTGSPGYRLLDRYARDLPGVEEMAIASDTHVAVSYVDGNRVTLDVRATNGAYFRVLAFDFVDGGPLLDEDDVEARPVAVLSEGAAARMVADGGGSARVGSHIELDGRRYTVRGIVRNVSMARAAAYADVWIPIGTLPGVEWRERLMGGFSALLLARSPADFGTIRAAFKERLARVEFPDPKAYDRMEGGPLTRLETVAAALFDSTDASPHVGRFYLALAVGALLFMALPAINLVNVNVSRISERAGEIGVRKAFGASVRDLVGQFVAENVVLCLIGGALGLLAAVAILDGLNGSGLIPHAEFHVGARVAVWAIGLSIAFGVLSGAYPAWRMARLHPVEALRGGAA